MLSAFKLTVLLLSLCVVFASEDDLLVSEKSNSTDVKVEEKTEEDDIPKIPDVTKLFDLSTSDLVKSLVSVSPSLSPALTFGTLSYIAYIGLTMAFPSLLKSVGLPELKDFSVESKSSRLSASLMDILAGEFLKNVLSESDVVDTLISVGKDVVGDGVSAIRRVTGTVKEHVTDIQENLDTAIKMLNSDCLSRYLCEAGHYTNSQFPTLAYVLRSIDSHYLDEYAQILVDGTVMEDCKAVYDQCEL